MERQKTIKKETRVNGVGIHTGKAVQLCFKPAEKNSGINFIRTDLAAKPMIRASLANVQEEFLELRRTSLGNNGVKIHTVEHLISALFGLGIDNVLIEITAEEIPALDGAAWQFCKLLKQAGIIELDGSKATFTVTEPLCLKEGDGLLAVFPDEQFQISYTLSYAEPPLNQYLNLLVSAEAFTKELAPCKTFCLESEIEQLRMRGLGQGASAENTIVVSQKGVGESKSAFSDEFVRHKVLDLIGDFGLLAASIKAHVVAAKSGHSLNIKFLKQLDKMGQRGKSSAPEHKAGLLKDIAPPFDIEKIMQVLPHRYPFLLVDRVLEFQEGKHVVGVKNITANEQFFTGHFPNRPVMPGVLIIEAMAQTAGILMLSRAENRGKLAYFMSMDKVKFRKTVIPGDRLVLKIDVVRVKLRTIQIRGQAFVDDKIVAEADLMFSLVPKNV